MIYILESEILPSTEWSFHVTAHLVSSWADYSYKPQGELVLRPGSHHDRVTRCELHVVQCKHKPKCKACVRHVQESLVNVGVGIHH